MAAQGEAQGVPGGEAGRDEPRAVRLRRMRMRSWRRGTREMDLLLGHYADERLAAMDAPALDLYEALLAEADPDLYDWVTGRRPPPDRFAPLVGAIRDAMARRHRADDRSDDRRDGRGEEAPGAS